MAMIDYGAVVFKNGICQNQNQSFMDMQEAVGWCNDKIDGNYFAFAGDENLTVAIYKTFCYILVDKVPISEYAIWSTNEHDESDNLVRHRSYRFFVDGTEFCLRQIDNDDRVIWLKFTYRGDHYNIVYGYGIDSDFKVWNRVKVRYLGKKLSRKVDRLYNRFRKSKTLFC